MEEEILKLLIDYSLDGKMADMYYILKLAVIMGSDRNLQDYLYLIKKRKSKINSDLAYYSSKKEIVVYLDNIYKYINKHNVFKGMFNDFEKILYKNYVFTQIILHELVHVEQEKMVEDLISGNTPPNLKNLILYISRIRRIDEDILYSISPNERFADIDSFKIMLDVLERIKDKVPNLIDYTKGSIIYHTLRGYNKSSVSPTIDFTSKVDSFGFGKLVLSSYLNSNLYLTLEERIYYGLHISNIEHNLFVDKFYETKYSSYFDEFVKALKKR